MTIKPNKAGNYAASFRTQDGGRSTISLKTKNKEEAQKLAKAAKIAELEAAGKVARLTGETVQRVVAGKTITCEYACEEWYQWMLMNKAESTAHTSKGRVIQWMTEMGINKLPVSSVNQMHISDWVNTTNEVLGLNNRRQRLAAVSTFMEFCSARGWAVGRVAWGCKVKVGLLSHKEKEPRVREPFTSAEVRKLLNHTEGFWHIAVTLGWKFGFRISDVAALEWESLAVAKKIIVWTRKRDRRVELDCPDEILDLFTTVPITSEKYVFPDQAEMSKDQKKRAGLSRDFARILERLDIHGKSFHSLRHGNATQKFAELIEQMEREEAIGSVAKDLGHQSPETTKGYIHEK
jgi:integrase